MGFSGEVTGEATGSARPDTSTHVSAPRRATRLTTFTRAGAFSVWRYLRVLVPAAVLWYVIARWWVGNSVILPTPIDVYHALVTAASDGSLQDAIGISLLRLVIGFGIGVLVGLPLGIGMGLSRTMKNLVNPVVELLRPISGIAWIPLGLVLFGVGNSIIVYIIFYGAVFPILVNAADGASRVDAHLVQVGQSFGVSRIRRLATIILPGSMSMILTGMRIGIGTGWMALVAAELVGSHSGLGFSVQFYSTVLRTPSVMGYIVVIGVLGILINAIFLGVERLVMPWRTVER